MTAVALTALCAAMPISADAASDAPEWVHLLPAGEIRTRDGRGPYRVVSMQAIAESLKPGDRLPIDQDHATDLAAPQGRPAPARGWIVALEARADGLWGKVEWTGEGRRLVEDKAYRGLSPAILLNKAKEVLGVLRASLVNTPNLKGLVALNAEEDGMNWKDKLIELLKLGGEAGDAEIETALQAKIETADPAWKAKLLKLLKLDGSADAAAIETALQSAIDAAAGKPALQGDQSVLESAPYVALQSELTGVTKELNTLKEERSRDKAETFVDGAIAEGRVGIKPNRDLYISMHMENPERAEKLIGGMPKLSGSTHTGQAFTETAEDGLGEADRAVIGLMGLDETKYKESLAASGKAKETL